MRNAGSVGFVGAVMSAAMASGVGRLLESFNYFRRNRGKAHQAFVVPLHLFHRYDLGVALSGDEGEVRIQNLDLHFVPLV